MERERGNREKGTRKGRSEKYSGDDGGRRVDTRRRGNGNCGI